jgi:hypothetical protein
MVVPIILLDIESLPSGLLIWAAPSPSFSNQPFLGFRFANPTVTGSFVKHDGLKFDLREMLCINYSIGEIVDGETALLGSMLHDNLVCAKHATLSRVVGSNEHDNIIQFYFHRRGAD